MKHLIEKRNSLLDELDGLTAKIKTETRAFNEDELKRVDAIKAEIRGIDETLKVEEETRGLEKIVTKTTEQRSAEEIRKEQIKKEERDFIQFIKEGRATNLPVASNGSVIPQSIANMIVDKVKNLSPIFSLATHWDIKDDLIIPSYDYTSHTTAYQQEFTDITASAGVFTNVTLKSNIIGSLALIGRSLINRSDVPVLGFVTNEIAKSIANFLESELLVGAGGTGKLNGLNQIVAGQTLTGGTTLVITPQELIKLKMMVPQVYQANAVWIMHPNTLAYIQGLTAGSGNNLFLLGNNLSEDGGFTLLGKRVYVSDNMPQIGAGNKEIFYGDMSGLHIKMTQGVQMQVLTEKYATQYAIGVVAYSEIDSLIVEPQKIVAYKGL